MAKMLSLFLVPALLVVAAQAEIKILPDRGPEIYDMTDKSKSLLIFSCQATNNGSVIHPNDAQLKWYDPNENEITALGGSTFLEKSPDYLQLMITKPTEDDGGVYTCKGFVAGEEQQATKQLKIYKGIKVLSPNEQYIIDGTTDKVWCNISSTGEFTPSIRWYKINKAPDGTDDWESISPDSSKFIVHRPDTFTEDDQPYMEIRNVSLPDQHTYLCNVVVIKVMKIVSHKIKVIVTVPPTFTGEGLTVAPHDPVEGSRLEVNCRADGIPAPLYDFVKYADASRQDKEVIVANSSSGHHVIKNVSRMDEGLYECVAFNQGGRQNMSVNLNVRVPPTIEDPEDLKLVEAETARLACVSEGDPAPVLTWRHKDSWITYSTDSQQDIYVEQGEERDMDPETRVFRRELTLVIPDVRPDHTGQYVCKTENSVGEDEHTFNVEVDFKPVFGDKVDSHFYGWVGSDTNLTCKVKGNPVPSITWFKDGIQLKKDNVYDISDGESDVPYQAVSFLKPAVEEGNQDLVFGDYTCEATNSLGKNQVELSYNLAVVPEAPEFSLQGKAMPTSFKLELQRPLKEGGQPVTLFIVTYNNKSSELEPMREEVALEEGVDSVEAELTGLTPNTEYVINVSALNNVGTGPSTNITATTADYSIPGQVQITSKTQSHQPMTYQLTWLTPTTGGAEINHYMLEYAAVEKVNTSVTPWVATQLSKTAKTLRVDGPKTHVTLPKLDTDTYYHVKIKAINRIGASEWTTFIFKTNKGAQGSKDPSASSRMQASAALLTLVTMATASWRLTF